MRCALLLLCAVLPACARTGESGRAEPGVLSCLSAEPGGAADGTLVYAAFSVDSLETWDTSGLRLFLRPGLSGWTGEYQNAEGEWGGVHPGVLVDGDPRRGSISLRIPHGPGLPDTTVFRGRISCDSLWGEQQAYRQTPRRSVTYRREAGPLK